MVDYSWEIRKLRKHQTKLSVLAKFKMNEGLSPKDIMHNETWFAIAHGEARLFVEGLGTIEAIDCLLGLAGGSRLNIRPFRAGVSVVSIPIEKGLPGPVGSAVCRGAIGTIVITTGDRSLVVGSGLIALGGHVRRIHVTCYRDLRQST